MTLVILVRHAHSSANDLGILAGRSEGIHLSPTGRTQARRLATRIGDLPVKALRSSPLERCLETIAPWLNKNPAGPVHARPLLKIDPDLQEVDYGLWSGRKLRTLSKDPLWPTIQERPSQVTFPDGESIKGMQERAMRAVENALSQRGKGGVMLVSHGDVVKSIIATSLSMPLDEFQRIVIDPASISILDFSAAKPRLILMNDSHSPLNPNLFTRKISAPSLGGGSGTLQRKKVK